MKNHATSKVGEGMRIVHCKKHERKKIKIYCKTCEQDICSRCSIVAAHKGHDFEDLIEFSDSCRSIIANGAEQLSSRANKLNSLKDQVEISIKQVKQVLILAPGIIKCHFN
jgi:hypothetical protein